MVAEDDRAPEIVTDSPPFAIAVRLEGDVAISVVCGELDMATAPLIRQNLEPFRGRFRALAFDLVDLTFLDAAGLRGLRFSSREDGAGVSIRNPSRPVKRILEIVELEDLIDHTTLEVIGA
jgi:anti-anti-sigma factor